MRAKFIFQRIIFLTSIILSGEAPMAKSQDAKKTTKKVPLKTPKEKKLAKQEKKKNKK
jgi:hypothetical protein